MNDDSQGAYNTNSQIKFKTSVLKLRLCDYSNVYILMYSTYVQSQTRQPHLQPQIMLINSNT